ncbi:MAG: hypothetical protein KF796_19135 [Ramlibacter sp.]|nr:hypothetical protein [Ramlibacter sp.]
MNQPEFLRVRILKQLRAAQPESMSMADLGRALGLAPRRADQLVWLQLKLLREDGFSARSGAVRSYRHSITPDGITHLLDIEAGKIAGDLSGRNERHHSAQFLAGKVERQEAQRRSAAKRREFRAWVRANRVEPALTEADLCWHQADDRNIIRSVARPGQAPARCIASVFHLGGCL